MQIFSADVKLPSPVMLYVLQYVGFRYSVATYQLVVRDKRLSQFKSD